MACHVIRAPQRPVISSSKSIFLAGTTKVAWRERLLGILAPWAITVFDPLRPDWDSSWKEDMGDERFRDQVEWELEMQERADLVVVFFQAQTQAPVSLLELGLRARAPNCATMVVCEEGYWKRGNVQMVCHRYGLTFLDSEEKLAGEVVSWLEREASDAVGGTR